MASPNAEGVFLRIPALQPYAPIVRVGAAALAIHLGMSFVEIDDLRLVIDKAMIMLLDGLDGFESTPGAQGKASGEADLYIDVVFRIAENRFEFEATRSATAGMSETAVRLFDDTARELVDELRVDVDTGAIWLCKALADVR